MTTPNNAAALERLDALLARLDGQLNSSKADFYYPIVVGYCDELKNIRATLAHLDAITSQPSGEAPEWVELKRNEFGYFYQTSAPAVRMPTGRYFFHPTHPSADAPGVAVDGAMVERAFAAYKQSRGSYLGEVPPDPEDIRAALAAALERAP